MKPLITTCLVLCAVACGSGGQGPADYHAVGTPTAPTSQTQMPERPSDTVPPISSQAPPISSQTPTISSQTPPISSQSAGPTMVTVTCAQVVTAANRAGCTISDDDAKGCETLTAVGAPCPTQIQNLFTCLLQHATCDDKGKLDSSASCPSEASAMEACLVTYSPPATTCSRDTQCRDCGSTCLRCMCQANNDAAAIARCATNDCTNTTN